MSPRKPTIDRQDDHDDEDGVLEAETTQETDLTLHVADEQAVGLGRTPPERDEYLEEPREEDTR